MLCVVASHLCTSSAIIFAVFRSAHTRNAINDQSRADPVTDASRFPLGDESLGEHLYRGEQIGGVREVPDRIFAPVSYVVVGDELGEQLTVVFLETDRGHGNGTGGELARSRFPHFLTLAFCQTQLAGTNSEPRALAARHCFVTGWGREPIGSPTATTT